MNTPDDFEATPQYYGFPEKPMPHQVKTWGLQELFLAAYAKTGHRGQSAKEAGITIWCVDNWVQTDVYSIKKRMKEAHQRYVESLEELMDERLLNPTGHRGSDVLLMFKLKAEAPEKYREVVKVLGVSAPLQMLDKLKELAAKDMKEREALGTPDPNLLASPQPSHEGEAVSGARFDGRGSTPQPPKGPKREQGRMKRR
jgi:hypothetical protein